MERDNLAQSNTATSFVNFISKARVVQLVGKLAHRLSSIIIMLVFTLFAFVVLVLSVVLLTVESWVSTVLSQAKAPKKESLQDFVKGEGSSSCHLSQTK
jgi:hypothetical protein